MNDSRYEVQLNDQPQDVARKAVDMWINNQQRVATWQKDAVDALNYYMNWLPPKNTPWRNCSNINIPITRIKTDAMIVTAVQMLLGAQTVFRFKPKAKTNVNVAEMLNRVIAAEISQSANFRKENVGFMTNLFKYGVGFMEKHYIQYQQMVPRRIVEEIQSERLDEVQGVPVMVGEKNMRVRTAMVPRITATHMLENISPFNIIESPGAQCINKREDMRHARWLIINKNLNDHALLTQGYDPKVVRELMSRQHDKLKKNDVDKERDRRQGLSEENFCYGYRALDLWMWHVVPGENREILMHYVIADGDGGAPILLLEQECPFSHYSIPVIHESADPTAFRGEGIPRVLMPLQEKINTIHNMRHDATTLSLLKMWKYRIGSRFDTHQELYPGAVIGVSDMQDFNPVISNEQGIMPAVQEEVLAGNYIEKLSISDISTGTQSGLNPERTATGTVTLLNQAEAKVAHIVRMLQQGAMRELGYMYLEDTLQFHPIDNTLEYKDVLSEQGIDIDDEQAILQILLNLTPGELDLEIEVGDSAGMRAARSQAAMQALSVISQFPEAQMNYPAIKQLFDEIMSGLGYSNIKLMSVQEHQQMVQQQMALQIAQANLAQANESLTNVEREKARAAAQGQNE